MIAWIRNNSTLAGILATIIFALASSIGLLINKIYDARYELEQAQIRITNLENLNAKSVKQEQIELVIYRIGMIEARFEKSDQRRMMRERNWRQPK
jgi:hypothetical protein